MRYQNRTSNDCRVSNLNKSELDIFVNKALLIVISTIYENELLSKENLEIFKTGNIPLKDLKICTGITLIIDENLIPYLKGKTTICPKINRSIREYF